MAVIQQRIDALSSGHPLRICRDIQPTTTADQNRNNAASKALLGSGPQVVRQFAVREDSHRRKAVTA
jgi:hypothetical protein